MILSRHILFCVCLLSFFSGGFTQENSRILYRTYSGKVTFVSEAPLEMISAGSEELRGIIDPVERTFAFQFDIKTLSGFNSPLQQEHFYENYLEAEKHPLAIFSGKSN
jgi:hypothetical protein